MSECEMLGGALVLILMGAVIALVGVWVYLSRAVRQWNEMLDEMERYDE